MDEEGTEIPVKAPTTEFVFSLLVRLQTPMTETGPGSSAKFTCGRGDVRIVSLLLLCRSNTKAASTPGIHEKESHYMAWASRTTLTILTKDTLCP